MMKNSETTDLAAPPERGLFCNRTLNMRSIKAIGYDMDYTLIHYRSDEWEKRAYEHLKQRFLSFGWPIEALEFDPQTVARGLIIDTQLGNVIKANRFGFVKRATHGTRVLSYDDQRNIYARTIVDLSESRWMFLNTLFSLSEACMYGQLVDLLDQHKLPAGMGYGDLYRKVRETLDATHMEGKLKAEILNRPDLFVELEEETALALLDQKHAGKKLLLITNSEWEYTQPMMSYSFDRFLPKGMTWRELFDIVIVGARKPDFFTTKGPLFEVATPEGLLRPSSEGLRPQVAFVGGSAGLVEKHLKLSGDEILYVGDHMFGDVHVTKAVLRWRTALILRELEDEVRAVEAFVAQERQLEDWMRQKEKFEAQQVEARVWLQRLKVGYGPKVPFTEEQLVQKLAELKEVLVDLDEKISPLAKAASEQSNPHWGFLMRAGNDKSHLARQVERYADVYTSRVSNLLYATPFAFLRSPRGSLPHDPAPFSR